MADPVFSQELSARAVEEFRVVLVRVVGVRSESYAVAGGDNVALALGDEALNGV